MKRIVKLFLIMLVVSLAFTTGAGAKANQGKNSYVALGDSIPFGTNLSASNHSAARNAFPFLIGKEGDVRVRNLGVPGWTSEQLLNAVNTDQKFRQAIRHADYISLTIGNNDLLQALKSAQESSGGDSVAFMIALNTEIEERNIFGKITAIIDEVNTLTDAPIVLYNVYNPFQPDDQLHQIGDMILPGINQGFAGLAVSNPNVFLADAYSAFGNEQAAYVLPGDVHPTAEGQAVLAEIGLDAFNMK